MDKEYKRGKMDRSMKDPGLMILCKVKDIIRRRMLVCTPVVGYKTNFMERVFKNGPMVENMMVISKTE